MVLHFHADPTVPLPEQLQGFHPQDLLGLEDAGARDVVARQSLLRPIGGELLRFLFELIELAVEPVVGLLGDGVDAVSDVGVVVEGVRLFGKRIPERRVLLPVLTKASDPGRARGGLAIAIERGNGVVAGSIGAKPAAFNLTVGSRGRGLGAGAEDVGHDYPALG